MLPLLLNRKITGKLNNREIMKPSMMIIALTLLTIIFLPASSGNLSNNDNNQAWAQEQIISNNSNIQPPNGSNILGQNFNNSININYSAVSRPIDTLNATGLIGSIIPGGGQLSLPGNLGGDSSTNNSSGVNTSSSSSPPSIALPAPQSLFFGKWFMNVKKETSLTLKLTL